MVCPVTPDEDFNVAIVVFIVLAAAYAIVGAKPDELEKLAPAEEIVEREPSSREN
jgi:hypothetical protein